MAKTEAGRILEKYKQARNKRQQKDPLWQELDAYDRNDQWDLTTAPPWLPKPVTNFIHLVKYTKRAALSTDNPTGKLRPVSPDKEVEIDMLNKAFQYTWERIKARKVVRQNIETSKLLGTAIAHVYWEESKEGRMGTTVQGDPGYQFEGEMVIREIDPAMFFPDPTAFTIEDCQYIHIVERKPMEWVKKHPLFGKGLNSQDNIESTSASEDRGEIYLRDYTTEAKGLVDFHSHYEKIANGEGGFTYKCTYLVNDKIVHTIEKLRPNRYPFAILYDFPQRQDFWGMSTCQFLLDNQRIINKVESIIAMIGTLMQNPQKIVSRQSGINPEEIAQYGNLPGFTVAADGDPTRAVHYVTPPQIPTVLFNLLENAKQNIREISGLNEAYMGQNVGSLQTSSGVQSLIERATMRDRDQMYDIELYIEDLSNLIIDFMVTYYETPRMIRVMGQKQDEFEFVPFEGTKYADIEYDMFIDVSSKAPVTRARESQEAKELLNMQGQYGFPVPAITPQEAIKMMDFSNKDALIKRMDMQEMRNKEQEITQIIGMYEEVRSNGVDEMTAMSMAIQQMQQMDEAAKGTGSTSNSNNVQMQQQGANVSV